MDHDIINGICVCFQCTYGGVKMTIKKVKEMKCTLYIVCCLEMQHKMNEDKVNIVGIFFDEQLAAQYIRNLNRNYKIIKNKYVGVSLMRELVLQNNLHDHLLDIFDMEDKNSREKQSVELQKLSYLKFNPIKNH